MWFSTAVCSTPLVPLKPFHLQTSGLTDGRPTLVLLFISSEGLNGHNGLGVLGSSNWTHCQQAHIPIAIFVYIIRWA